MDNAFAIMRPYARDRNLPLREVAEALVSRRLRLGPNGTQ